MISLFQVPQFMEICFVPCTEYPSQYPGLFLFTTPARMMRPVRNLTSNQVEYIGTFEQVYLNISVTAKEVYPEVGNLTCTFFFILKTLFDILIKFIKCCNADYDAPRIGREQHVECSGQFNSTFRL